MMLEVVIDMILLKVMVVIVVVLSKRQWFKFHGIESGDGYDVSGNVGGDTI